MYKIAILGVGKMGGAILDGIVKSGLYNKKEILLYVHSEEKKDKYLNLDYDVTMDVNDLFKSAETIILAIKPQMFSSVLEDAKKYNFKDRAIISIAAGLTINYIEGFFKNAFIVRAMPNTPAQIGKGVTTLCSKDSNNPYFKVALNIFNSIGKAYKIEENQMDDSLALNGSMPAYLFYFAKGFIDQAVEDGIDFEVAKELCLEAIKGSADLVLNSKETIDTLIDNVCSKGGTTIAGLNMLKDNGFIDSIKKCSKACGNRSKELSK